MAREHREEPRELPEQRSASHAKDGEHREHAGDVRERLGEHRKHAGIDAERVGDVRVASGKSRTLQIEGCYRPLNLTRTPPFTSRGDPMVVGSVATMYSLSKRFCAAKNTSTLRPSAREMDNSVVAYAGRPGYE